jgi:hypothetical protein
MGAASERGGPEARGMDAEGWRAIPSAPIDKSLLGNDLEEDRKIGFRSNSKLVRRLLDKRLRGGEMARKPVSVFRRPMSRAGQFRYYIQLRNAESGAYSVPRSAASVVQELELDEKAFPSTSRTGALLIGEELRRRGGAVPRKGLPALRRLLCRDMELGFIALRPEQAGPRAEYRPEVGGTPLSVALFPRTLKLS